jgi:hypothetical protein
MTDVMDPEWLARKFHEAYERLAPAHDYRAREESVVTWEELPSNNKKLMIAVCGELISEGIVE